MNERFEFGRGVGESESLGVLQRRVQSLEVALREAEGEAAELRCGACMQLETVMLL